MPRYGMFIDATKCVGCHACRMACQNQNELPPEENFNRIEEREYGRFPNFNREFIPVQCQHCENPPCLTVCPTGATYKRKDGVVLVDDKKCVGCKYCMVACPYSARVISKGKGIVEKCRFCIEMVEKGGQPACVTTCMTGVRTFGDLNDPKSKISIKIGRFKARALRADMNTRPSIFYRKA